MNVCVLLHVLSLSKCNWLLTFVNQPPTIILLLVSFITPSAFLFIYGYYYSVAVFLSFFFGCNFSWMVVIVETVVVMIFVCYWRWPKIISNTNSKALQFWSGTPQFQYIRIVWLWARFQFLQNKSLSCYYFNRKSTEMKFKPNASIRLIVLLFFFATKIVPSVHKKIKIWLFGNRIIGIVVCCIGG